MQIRSLSLGAAFGEVKIAVSPVTLYSKQHCITNAALSGITGMMKLK